MEIKEFIENFANQFDETDPSEIKTDTKFKELEEWSSLTALSIIAMADEEYGIILKAEDIQKANTPEDIFNIILKLKN